MDNVCVDWSRERALHNTAKKLSNDVMYTPNTQCRFSETRNQRWKNLPFFFRLLDAIKHEEKMC